MEYFRWILVAIGLLILLGIVLFANPERKQSMTRSKKKDSKSTAQRQEPVLDMHDEEVYLARQQTITGLNVDKAPSDDDAAAEASDKLSQRDDQHAASAAAGSQAHSSSESRPQSAPAMVSGRAQSDEHAHARANVRSGADDSIEQLFKNNVFSLYIVAERREPIAGVELLNAAVKIGLDFGEHGIFHRVHPESGESIFSMANLTAPGSFDPTAWNLFETRGVSLFMPLPGPLGAMNGWDTMLASAERLSSLLSARIVNARREPLSRQQVAQIREQMRQFDRRRQ
ncbi:MAG: cell division protein ZipA [Gammaproteobacteria bacterium]|nr:cell division protein ZipA [Gammaproteobacteria bacterium]